jgi:hypothetical protein
LSLWGERKRVKDVGVWLDTGDSRWSGGSN